MCQTFRNLCLGTRSWCDGCCQSHVPRSRLLLLVLRGPTGQQVLKVKDLLHVPSASTVLPPTKHAVSPVSHALTRASTLKCLGQPNGRRPNFCVLPLASPYRVPRLFRFTGFRMNRARVLPNSVTYGDLEATRSSHPWAPAKVSSRAKCA